MDESHVDRRRSFRVPVHGLALLWHEHRIAGRYALGDLSISGCMLRNGPPCVLGDEYNLVLDLDERALRIPVKAVRQQQTELGAREIGLQFLVCSPVVEDQIQDLVMQTVARERLSISGRVLVVDTDIVRRRDTSDNLRKLGHEVLEAATPLEAVWELENGPMDVHTVIVARRLGSCDGRDLLRFIGSRYAGVWRVMVADDRDAGDPVDALLLGPARALPVRRGLSKPLAV